MKYLLDTNICIYLLNGNAVLNAKISEIGISSLAISNSVLAELYFGAYNSQKVEKNLIRIGVTQLKFNIPIFIDANFALHKSVYIKSDI